MNNVKKKLHFFEMMASLSSNDDNKISQMLFPRYLDGKNVKFSTVPVALLALEAAHRFRELSN